MFSGPSHAGPSRLTSGCEDDVNLGLVAVESIEDRELARQDLAPCVLEAEPGGAVDLGVSAEPAAARRPFDGEAVADDRLGVEIALERERLDIFAALLADAAERDEPAFGPHPQLLLEFAPGAGLERLPRLDQALRDRPGAFVLAAPLRPAEVGEQNLPLFAPPAPHQYPGTERRGHSISLPRPSRAG